MIEISAEPLQYKFNDSCIDIPVPSAHIGLKPLNVRLISAVRRQGMVRYSKVASQYVLDILMKNILFLFLGSFIGHRKQRTTNASF